MREDGVARARHQRARAIARGTEAKGGPVKRLAREATAVLARALESWATRKGPGRPHKALPLLRAIGWEVAAHYAVSVTLNSVSRTQNCGEVVRAIGARLETELRMAALERADPDARAYLVKVSKGRSFLQAKMHRTAVLKRAGLTRIRIPKDQRVRAAWVLLELLTRETGIFDVVTVNRRGHRGKIRQERKLEPHPDTVAWLESAQARLEASAFVHRPLTEGPPAAWDETLEAAGYHTPALAYDLVKDLPSVEVERRAPAVARAANVLQGAAWRVNARVLEIARECWDRGLEAPLMPRPEKVPKPPFPEHGDEGEITGWKREVAMLYRADERRVKVRLRTAHTVRAAAELADAERFYVAMRSDFRGRLYPLWPVLTWQGTDLARGLLEFAEAVPWEPRDAAPYGWLARRLASTFGLSRASYAVRESWAGKHRQDFVATASDPIGRLGWWSTAKEPWQFLAACCAWRDLELGGGDAHLRLPVAVDASNNAVQIYSLLMRDEALALATNAAPREEPGDAYSDVAALVTRRLEASEDARATAWLDYFGGFVGRDVCKAVLVGLVYGAHAQGLVKTVLTWYEELPTWPFGARRAFVVCSFLAWEIHHALREYTSGTFEVLGWLRDLARKSAKAGWPVTWTSPSGFEVVQDHRRATTRQITTMVGEVVRAEPLFEDTVRPDVQTQARSMPPNFVHSLDAAVLHLALGELEQQGVSAIGTAHDAFAVPAAQVGVLHRTLRRTYARVFERDLLEELRAEVSRRTGLEISAPPEGGRLDPEAVAESSYLFS